MGRNETKDDLKNIQTFVKKSSHTNVIVMSIAPDMTWIQIHTKTMR